MTGPITIGRGAALLVAIGCLIAFGFCTLVLTSSLPGSPICGPGCLEQALGELAQAHPIPNAETAAKARNLIEQEKQFSPVDVAAWLREAALDAQVAGKLDAAAQRALLMSYRAAPIDAGVARWRLDFVFEHWDELTAELRGAAVQEIGGLMSRPGNVAVLKDILPTIRNPTGRLVCSFMLAGLSRAGSVGAR